MAERVRSGELSWREVEAAIARGAAALFPMGSTEEHGPQSPTGDYLVAEEIAVRVARQTGDLVFPVLPFSYSEYFRHYPGTITLRSETLSQVVKEVVECLIAHGFRHIVLVNGHKGNEPTLGHLIRDIRRQHGLLVPIVSPLGFAMSPEFTRELYGDVKTGHGGEPMGSIASYLFPGRVDLARAEAWETKPFLGLPPTGLSGVSFDGTEVGFPIDMEDLTPPSGSLTDPSLASPERGERIVERSVSRIADFVRWFKSVDPRVTNGRPAAG